MQVGRPCTVKLLDYESEQLRDGHNSLLTQHCLLEEDVPAMVEAWVSQCWIPLMRPTGRRCFVVGVVLQDEQIVARVRVHVRAPTTGTTLDAALLPNID